MGKKELVGTRQYTDEFKVEAVRLGESMGGNQAAKRLGTSGSEGGRTQQSVRPTRVRPA